jgi:hypothetical protein
MGNSYSDFNKISNFCKYKNYLTNGLFSEPPIPKNTYRSFQKSTVNGWNSTSTGILINNSSAWGYPMPYPCGDQACSIQMTQSINTTFSVPKVGTYLLVIIFCGRNCCNNNNIANTLNINLNGKQIDSIVNPPINSWKFKIIKLSITQTTNNILEIKGTSTTDKSTAIKMILTDNLQSELPSSMLKVGEKLIVGGVKYSDNKEYFMTLQKDGNLCIYNNSEIKIWCSGKTTTMPTTLIMESTGSLNINSIESFALISTQKTQKINNIWSSNSDSLNITHASLDNDGNLRIWDKSNQFIWSSSTDSILPIDPIQTNIKTVNFNYDNLYAPVYIIGDYGLAPWGKNKDFPDMIAKWIWYSPKSNISAPTITLLPINIQYIYENTSGIPIVGKLNIIIDNKCDVFLNSIQIGTSINGGWGAKWPQIDFIVLPGKNLFEFKVKNDGGPAGLLVSAITTGEGPDNNKVLFNTNSDWKFIPLISKPIESCNLSSLNLISNVDKFFPWGCLVLNGNSTQYVNIGKTITGMNGLSFTCWFRSDKNKNMARIIDFGNDRGSNNIILCIANNKLAISTYIMNKTYQQKNVNLTPEINNNQWNHVVWTIKPSTLGAIHTIYLNNNIVLSIQDEYPINMERTNCYLGKSNWSNDPYFIGAISNFAMYQKELSVKEIKALYYNMINLNDPSLYIYLPFSTNSVLDTLLNNYAGKLYNLPITKSKVENENWNCLEEGKQWISVKMENNNPVCMSLDGKTCVESEKTECTNRNNNPVVPQNPVICSKDQTGWCDNAKKMLTNTPIKTDNNQLLDNKGISINTIKPGVKALSALEINNNDKILNLKPLPGGGQVLSLSNMVDVNNLMIGGVFKLRVNLPMMPPYIKGQTFDTTKGIESNYFYLSIEKLDNNCQIKNTNGSCTNTFADDKKCNIKSLTSLNTGSSSNTFRLVLVSSQYVLDPSIPIGKNSDFTLVKVNEQLYLKNVQTGFLPSLYSSDSVLPVYGDMMIKENSNANQIYNKLYNTMCNQEIPKNQITGTSFVKCDIKQDPGTYLITTKNIGTSTPVRININSDKTISLNLLSFNTYGYPTKVSALTFCNFNVSTYSYIEKITNTFGTFMINMVCFEDTQNTKANSQNQLKFTVELINFPSNFVKDNSVFEIN